MHVAFVVNDLQLSGGVGVVLEHGRRLSGEHDFEVTFVLAREQDDEAWRYSQLDRARVVDLATARRMSFDIAVATWWETALVLFELPAQRHAYFVQSLEDRFYDPVEPEWAGAAITLNLPVAFITEASWIAETLHDLRPGAPVHLVRNGIDKDAFVIPAELAPRDDGPLRVLVEGNPIVGFKHVPEALAAATLMTEPHHVTLVCGQSAATEGLPYDRRIGPLSHAQMAQAYAESHVVLKLSSVEGMFGPPLEGMHMGATCVVTPVTGHDEYVRHGVNGLVCDWDDLGGTARLLDLLARDSALLDELRRGALETARAWPSWESQAAEMATALRAIAAEPSPDPVAAAATLARDIRLEIERARTRKRRADAVAAKLARLERVKTLPGISVAYRAWQRPFMQKRVAPRVMRAGKRLSRGS